jgi:hypothetical protein
MGKTQAYGLFQGQVYKEGGTKVSMVAKAKKINQGHVAVWQLTTEGKRIGRKPVYRAFDGVEK